MSPLHAPTAAAATAHVNVKLPDDHPCDWQFFLILRGDARSRDGARAVGTACRQWNIVPLVHARRPPPTGLRTIGRACCSAWLFRILLQRLPEWRGLSESRPPCLVQLSFQVIDPVSEPFGFLLQSVTLTS
jgi:hypothetical protein